MGYGAPGWDAGGSGSGGGGATSPALLAANLTDLIDVGDYAVQTGTSAWAASFAQSGGKITATYPAVGGTRYGHDASSGLMIPLTDLLAGYDPAVHSSGLIRLTGLSTSDDDADFLVGFLDWDGGAGRAGDGICFGKSGGFICQHFETSAANFTNTTAGTYKGVELCQGWGAGRVVSTGYSIGASGGKELRFSANALAAGFEASHLWVAATTHGVVTVGATAEARVEVYLFDDDQT